MTDTSAPTPMTELTVTHTLIDVWLPAGHIRLVAGIATTYTPTGHTMQAAYCLYVDDGQLGCFTAASEQAAVLAGLEKVHTLLRELATGAGTHKEKRFRC